MPLEFSSPFVAFMYANHYFFADCFLFILISILIRQNIKLKDRISDIEHYLRYKEEQNANPDFENQDEDK